MTMMLVQLRCCMGVGVRWFSTVSRTTRVVTVLRDKPVDQTVKINGWVKGIRRQKERTFLDVDDGSCFTKLQVVLPTEQRPAALAYHSAVSVSGVVCASTHKGQEVEVLAHEVQVVGGEMCEDYPFKARQTHPADYIRRYPHLRARTNTFASMLRVRSQMKMAIQQYFEREGFINIDTPILTANDCEGGGEVFVAQHYDKKSNDVTDKKTSDATTPKAQDWYFGHPAYLTVSGQLHLEAMANGLSKVYNFNPAFRAENALSRRHLAEFWMVEAEEAFMEGGIGLDMLMRRVEGLLKAVMAEVVDAGREDVEAHWSRSKGTEERVRMSIDQPFTRITYNEALEMLNQQPQFSTMEPGDDLNREHELCLIETLGNTPVFVTHWPLKCKPFYMCASEEDPEVALAMDLLLPDVGEVAGGSLREHRLPALLNHHPTQTLPKDQSDPLAWYLDLRALGGGVPSGGFGVGVERMLQFLLGISNIKDAVPFPRWVRHCSC